MYIYICVYIYYICIYTSNWNWLEASTCYLPLHSEFCWQDSPDLTRWILHVDFMPPESPTQNRLLPSYSGNSGAICFILKDVSLQRWRMSLRRCLHWDWFGKTLDDSTCSFFALPKLPYPYWSCHTRCLKAKTWWSKTFLKLLLQRLLPLREFFPCALWLTKTYASGHQKIWIKSHTSHTTWPAGNMLKRQHKSGSES